MPLVALGVAVLAALAGLGWLMMNFLNSAPPTQKKMVQEIRVIRPPPPPPDEPPPPPPPEEKVDVNEPQPEPEPVASNEPPPGDQLGLDADGTGEGDGFGLAARKGGRDLLASGGSAYTWYANLLKAEILSLLQDDQKIRNGSYSVQVRVWVKPDGMIERVGVGQSTGDRERDRMLEKSLARMVGRVIQGLPADTPQPISLRIVSRA